MNQEYIVKKGDTLWGISNQYGVSVTELAELNSVNADTLRIGQVLIIPIKSGINPDNMFMYTVKRGDSLYNIAKVYGTTVDAIKNLNYLKSDVLQIGQVIRIPETYTNEDDYYLPVFTNYMVKKGDTLYSVSKKFNLSVDTIIQDNALKNNNLFLGQNLKIRQNDVVIEECFGEDVDISLSNFFDYYVQKGDSLYNIAKRFNVSVSELISLNNLKNTNLSIGQTIKIPSINKKYIVVKGDSLYSIAKKFNTSVSELLSKNNLKSSSLSIGQELII